MKKISIITAILFISIVNAQLYTPGGVVSTSSTGNVGIGIPSPESKLDIGTDNTQKTFINYQNKSSITFIPNNGSWFHISNTNGTNNALTISQGANVDQHRLLTIKYTGEVGIGTDAPQAKLDVMGDVWAANFISSETRNSSNAWIFHTPSSNQRTALYIAPKLPNGSWDWDKQTIFDKGNIAVSGKLEATEVKVTQTPTADFVFEESYSLPNLEDVEQYIKDNKHLPEIASAKEMEKDGVNIGQFQIKLLQKIEELTLYSIEQNKQLKIQNEKLNIQAEKIEKLENALTTQKNK